MKKKTIVILVASHILLAAICFFAGVAVIAYSVQKKNRDRWERCSALWRKPAPAIEGLTLEGRPWRLSDYKGKIVVLDFWATWCPGCPSAIEGLKPLFEEFGKRDDFVMMGVSLDDDADIAQKFCGTRQVHWPQLLEPKAGWKSRIAKDYGVNAVPAIRIIDKQGVLRIIDDSGFDLRWAVKELLENKPARDYSRTSG